VCNALLIKLTKLSVLHNYTKNHNVPQPNKTKTSSNVTKPPQMSPNCQSYGMLMNSFRKIILQSKTVSYLVTKNSND